MNFLGTNTWFFNVKQYLFLSSFRNANITISNKNRTQFASSYLKETASVWWYDLVSSGTVTGTWNTFKTAVSRAFVPCDNAKRERDKLHEFQQTDSVSRDLSEFWNIVLTISSVTDEENLNRFANGLKQQICFQVLKVEVHVFDECARVACGVQYWLRHLEDLKGVELWAAKWVLRTYSDRTRKSWETTP